MKEYEMKVPSTNERPSRGSLLKLELLCFVAFLLGCGGGQQGPPPTVADFSVSVSPNSTLAVVGNTTPNVLISINPQNGFAGTVNVTLQGVPSGVTAMPAASFSLDPGASEMVKFVVSDSAAVGPSTITIQGTSGTLSHNTMLSLTADASVRTYQSGSMLYLESGTATDTARIGLDTDWGGSIVEASLNRTDANRSVLIRLCLHKFSTDYCIFAYSALACFRMGMSGSASFQRVRNSS